MSRRALLTIASLAALVLPSAAAAGGSGAMTKELGAGTGPACSSENVIAFSGIVLYRVRHFGNVQCDVPTAIRCESRLLDLGSDPVQVISRVRETGQRQCSFDSGPSEELYELTHPFRETFFYKISLVRESHIWGEPSRFCTRVSRDRKTLTCRASHKTIAPLESRIGSD